MSIDNIDTLRNQKIYCTCHMKTLPFLLLVVPLDALVFLIVLDWWAQLLLQIYETYTFFYK